MEHQYWTHGKYKVEIFAHNNIGGEKEISSIAVVDVALHDMKIFSTHPHLTKNIYIQKGHSIMIQVTKKRGKLPTKMLQRWKYE